MIIGCEIWEQTFMIYQIASETLKKKENHVWYMSHASLRYQLKDCESQTEKGVWRQFVYFISFAVSTGNYPLHQVSDFWIWCLLQAACRKKHCQNLLSELIIGGFFFTAYSAMWKGTCNNRLLTRLEKKRAHSLNKDWIIYIECEKVRT